MNMNETPGGERIHIGLFGKRNAGKSSLLNAISGQQMAIVSEVKGTTTDPVRKAMELLPLGPVVLIDTPGLDDDGILGEERIKKTEEILRRVDLLLLVLDMEDVAEDGDGNVCRMLVAKSRERNIPFLICLNKADLVEEKIREDLLDRLAEELSIEKEDISVVSAKEKQGIEELKGKMAKLLRKNANEVPLVRDLLQPGDTVVLVVPIDSAAPKGRLILPQQQVIRDALEAGAIPVVTRETELELTMRQLCCPPKLVVTDSQVFRKVSEILPEDQLLTSFSILMARYKGDLGTQIAGAKAIEQLKDGDIVLISEGCTHHRQCEDIGTVKMPRWIRDYTQKDISFSFTSGGEFPQDLSAYALIVHCGGCMLNPKEMRYRLTKGVQQQIPVTNYGVLIAYMNGILDRVIHPFETGRPA